MMLDDAIRSYFLETLTKGEYNLLLGAGVSLDSKNVNNEFMLSGQKLKDMMAFALGANPNTPMNRLSRAISPSQHEEFLTKGYTVKSAGKSLKHIPNYVWRNIFTFNIDNVLEYIYQNDETKKQHLESINFVDTFSVERDCTGLRLIHLHGTVDRVTDQYIFSINDYVKIMRETNPWMVFLSELLTVEPFIIAGASLSEPDLEFYLSKRTVSSPRKTNAPSLLIEPFPDPVVEHECKERGIVLVKATVEDFMEWVIRQVPRPPTVQDLFDHEKDLFKPGQISELDSIKFSMDFRSVTFHDTPPSSRPSSFFYGAKPTVKDISQHLDIERENCFDTYNKIWEAVQTSKRAIHLIVDDPFSGKSTFAYRILEKLSSKQVHIIKIANYNRIDTKNTISCLKKIRETVIIFVENMPDRMSEINDLLDSSLAHVFIIGTARSYRSKFVEDTSISEVVIHTPSRFSEENYLRLIESYRTRGLVGKKEILSTRGVDIVKNDVVGVAICRIMNDFRPLQTIVRSLIKDTSAENLRVYFYVALAQYCYDTGIAYRILQSLVNAPIGQYVDTDLPLKITTNANHTSFLVCQNEAVAQAVLDEFNNSKRQAFFDSMVALSRVLAPYVNRKTIMKQTPEARISRRLLNFNDVVSKFVSIDPELFYQAVQSEWEWNSRYWEQRALAILQTDRDIALSYARQATAIEEHPFTLNTYATVLYEHLKCNDGQPEQLFDEIVKVLGTAITLEKRRSRLSVYPLTTLVSSTVFFCRQGHHLSSAQKSEIRNLVASVEGSMTLSRELSQKVREVAAYI